MCMKALRIDGIHGSHRDRTPFLATQTSHPSDSTPSRIDALRVRRPRGGLPIAGSANTSVQEARELVVQAVARQMEAPGRRLVPAQLIQHDNFVHWEAKAITRAVGNGHVRAWYLWDNDIVAVAGVEAVTRRVLVRLSSVPLHDDLFAKVTPHCQRGRLQPDPRTQKRR